MSVIVKGMEMPEYTTKAEFGIDADGNPLCMVYNEAGTEPDIYEIIPLPEMHGDLIDISEKVNIEYYDDMNEEWSLMEGTVEIALFRCCEDFPKVIIEAEGE